MLFLLLGVLFLQVLTWLAPLSSGFNLKSHLSVMSFLIPLIGSSHPHIYLVSVTLLYFLSSILYFLEMYLLIVSLPCEVKGKVSFIDHHVLSSSRESDI